MSWSIGLDVHKDTIAAAALNPSGVLTADVRQHSIRSRELHSWIVNNSSDARCGLEPSGGVGHAAAALLQQRGSQRRARLVAAVSP